jgi:aryl-alcohol dehydrogenase-like predicted oxidoreductase
MTVRQETVQHRRLGSSGLQVSALGVGCWAIGGPAVNLGLPMGWSTADDKATLRGLLRAFELGATLFDTADVYGLGHSERLLGRFLRQVLLPASRREHVGVVAGEHAGRVRSPAGRCLAGLDGQVVGVMLTRS